jgi:peptidoglycan/LPS O-acetylase OafA/YrhL
MNRDQETRLNSLTGLRFVAAMVVFISHFLEIFPILGDKTEASFIIAPLGLGGVGFFYVLSGFILTYVYQNRSNSFSVREFYLKRFARVWPLHLVTLLIVLLGVVTLRHQLGREHGVAQLVSNFLLMQSWWPDYDWVFCINGPSWSLSNEAFFYLVFPWMIAGGAVAFRKKLIVYAVACTFAIGGLALLMERGVISAESTSAILRANPLLRSFDFLVGMLCGFIFLKRQNRDLDQSAAGANHRPFHSTFVHLAVLFGCIAYYGILDIWVDNWRELVARPDSVLLTWLCFSGAAPLFALAIFAFAKRSSHVSGLLASPLMVYLGELSFALYLIHQPIMVSLHRQTMADSPSAIWWTAAAALALSLAASMLLHHLVELPARAGLIQCFSSSNASKTWLGRCSSLLTEQVRSIGRLCCYPRLVVITALTIIGFTCADAGRFNFRDPSQINHVVKQSPETFRGIQFDEDATLKGLLIDRGPDDSWQLQMVWDLKQGRRPIRFLHICDAEGKILRHGNDNRAMFSSATGNEVVLDRVTVTPEQLESASMLAIGFYGPERQSAPIANPRPGQETHRLRILNLDRQATVQTYVR